MKRKLKGLAATLLAAATVVTSLPFTPVVKAKAEIQSNVEVEDCYKHVYVYVTNTAGGIPEGKPIDYLMHDLELYYRYGDNGKEVSYEMRFDERNKYTTVHPDRFGKDTFESPGIQLIAKEKKINITYYDCVGVEAINSDTAKKSISLSYSDILYQNKVTSDYFYGEDEAGAIALMPKVDCYSTDEYYNVYDANNEYITSVYSMKHIYEMLVNGYEPNIYYNLYPTDYDLYKRYDLSDIKITRNNGNNFTLFTKAFVDHFQRENGDRTYIRPITKNCICVGTEKSIENYMPRLDYYEVESWRVWSECYGYISETVDTETEVFLEPEKDIKINKGEVCDYNELYNRLDGDLYNPSITINDKTPITYKIPMYTSNGS